MPERRALTVLIKKQKPEEEKFNKTYKIDFNYHHIPWLN